MPLGSMKRSPIDLELNRVAEAVNAATMAGKQATTEDLRRVMCALRGHYVTSEVVLVSAVRRPAGLDSCGELPEPGA
jgi:hypothetical protein